MSDSEFCTADPVYLISGNLGKPGAPILSLALMYDPVTGLISGQGLITQAIAPPNGRIGIHGITGVVHGLGLGGVTRVISLKGTFQHSLTPPAIGEITEKFEATFVTDNSWQGHGSFAYGGQRITNVPVKPRG